MSRGLKAAFNAVRGRHSRKPFDIDAFVDGPDAEARLLVDPAQFKDALFSMLRAAEQEIAIEYYIVEDDEFSDALFKELQAACARGVKVRFIVDGVGSRLWLLQKIDTLRQCDVQIRVYHPLPSSLREMRTLAHAARGIFNYLVTFNRRDHRKLVLVDGRCAILGSHNIWNESLQWREASLVLGGSSAKALRESYERVWLRTSDLDGNRKHAVRNRIQAPGRKSLPACEGVLDNTTRRFARIRNKAIMELIAKSEKRLWITTPYLWPHRTMLRLITSRARAGVDVKLILPRKSDVRVSRWMAQSLYAELLECGINIYEFTGAVLHAKVMVVDDRFLLGTSNLNHRSFLQDLEIDYLGRDPKLLEALVAWKHDTLAQCEQIKDVAQVEHHILKRCMAGLLRPLRGYF